MAFSLAQVQHVLYGLKGTEVSGDVCEGTSRPRHGHSQEASIEGRNLCFDGLLKQLNAMQIQLLPSLVIQHGLPDAFLTAAMAVLGAGAANHLQPEQIMLMQRQQLQLLMMQQQQQHVLPHLQYHPSSTQNTSTPTNKSGQFHATSTPNTSAPSNKSGQFKAAVQAEAARRAEEELLVSLLPALSPALVSSRTPQEHHKRPTRASQEHDIGSSSGAGAARRAELDAAGTAQGAAAEAWLQGRIFAYQTLHKATRGFAKRLGSGGFGSVFEGTLACGTQVV